MPLDVVAIGYILIAFFVVFFLTFTLSSRMRLSLEIYLIFIITEFLTIVIFLIQEPSTFYEIAVLAFIPITGLIIVSLRFNSLFKDPFKYLIVQNEKIINSNFIIADESELDIKKYRGEMKRIIELDYQSRKKLINIINGVTRDDTAIIEAGNNIGALSQKLSESNSELTNDVDSILQSIVVIADLTASISMEINKDLGEISTKYKQVIMALDKADRLTDQTNLIAVNASIEAAHTGSTNDNFGIVADSIQQLSSRSRNTTDKLIDEVKEFNNLLENNLNTLIGSIERIEDIGYQIGELANNSSSVSHQQMTTINDMQSNINKIVQSSKEITKSFKDIVV